MLTFTALPATSRAEARVDYLQEIKPLLAERCYSCHGALKQNARLRLDTVELMRQGGKRGAVIKSRQPDKSLLLARVAAADPEERMPPEGDPLTPEQISLLCAWIQQGAKAPRSEKPEPDPRQHWAFIPPQRPAIPKVRNSKFEMGNSLDAFINRELEKHGLTPAPPAEKHVLLRRVHLDLIGLPPTREALHAFLADDSPAAYERVVDRLLSDPGYGERWGRHWMDVWRYSDWFGRRQVPDVWNSAPQIWRWRDWIVRSLNEDQGYDRMLKEMLAADEIAPEDHEAAVATGFLVRNWYALNPNQWMRDNVEHTAKAFLGLTYNCAHCHDHKYDPITQQDYFSLRAFFEPIYVRQDRWPGEADPGPFQDYEYSKVRKIQRLGAVRVFDQQLDAPTWFYTGGDERNRLTNLPPVAPAVPAFFSAKLPAIQTVKLPPAAFYPGLNSFVHDAELARVEQSVKSAREQLIEIERADSGAPCGGDSPPELPTAHLRAAQLALARAEAERVSVTARIAADKARHLKASNEAVALSQQAAAAECRFKLAAARESLAQAELKLEGARSKLAAATDEKAKEGAKKAVTQAEQELAAAKKTREQAESARATEGGSYTPFSPSYPTESTGRRMALAEWIGSGENPLTARVAVNHIWLRHFHAPLVASVYDFGRSGAAPTHPELLDWLAVEFMANGWSMKHLHRLMVTSAAYRRSSSMPPVATDVRRLTSRPNSGRQNFNQSLPTSPTAGWNVDPENRYLWRMNTGRMEAEVVRDSILHLSGQLDLQMGGQELENKDMADSNRRTLYFACHPEIGGAGEFTGLFDPPDPNECYRRTRSLVPQQALGLTNSKLVHDQSLALAQRLWNSMSETDREQPAAFVTASFEHILTRKPNPTELQACKTFLEQQSELARAQMIEEKMFEAEKRARESLIRALLNHHDFLAIR